MESDLLEGRGKRSLPSSKPRFAIKKSKTFASQWKTTTPKHKDRVEKLISHHLFGAPLQGIDKDGSGILLEHGIRHFHLELQKPDPLLSYQLKDGIINLLNFTTHKDNFDGNENSYLAAVLGDLV